MFTRGQTTQNPPETQLLRGDFGEQERQVLRHWVWLVGGGEEPIGLQTPEKKRAQLDPTHQNYEAISLRPWKKTLKFGTQLFHTTYNKIRNTSKIIKASSTTVLELLDDRT